MATETLGILEQRRIEAAFAKGIYEEMKAQIGEAQAKAIMSSAIIKLAKETAAEMAKQGPEGKPSLEHFISLQPLWTKGDALQIETCPSSNDLRPLGVLCNGVSGPSAG
ncbi:MAG: L-2-amino-thiazoline-4-carboxylic acid hydrolase [Roseomonas sp.]|nr:L-2-amino-thiazoline-4-carboxylic acid hydrolase [Roseomonas sp.]MCA3297777.1 L-2-amino-thiazoline-4-carboxylic acid hydrolase [Roseomonas sp.]